MRVSDSALLSTHCSSLSVTPNNVRQLLLVYYNFILPVLSVQHQFGTFYMVRLTVVKMLHSNFCPTFLPIAQLLFVPVCYCFCRAGQASVPRPRRGDIEFEIRYVVLLRHQSPKET